MAEPKKHSDEDVAQAWEVDGGVWQVPNPYVFGVCVVWQGVRLLCTRDHYAGGDALHPWDPGHGWDVLKAASLWTPDGDVNTARLLGMAAALELTPENERLRMVMSIAAGITGS
jgi:hypothetical protein